MTNKNSAHRLSIGGSDVRLPAHRLRFLGWLMLMAFIAGLISLLSYSLAGQEIVRAEHPRLGAWWGDYQFYFMEGAATALGLLLGIRAGGGAVAGSEKRSRAAIAALVVATIALAPLVHLCAAIARFGWNGHSASFATWIVGREGYELGRQVDKVAMTGIYFLKTAGFGFLAGLALMALACIGVCLLGSGSAGVEI